MLSITSVNSLVTTRMDIVISSRYRTSGERYDFQTNLLQDSRGKTKYRLVNASIPLTGYVFRNSFSSIFQIQELAGSAISIVLPDGNYESSLMGGVIEALIVASALTGVYTVSFSDIDNKMTISSVGPTFRLIFPETELAYIFGFSDSTTAYANTFSSSFCFNFSQPDYLFARISGLNNINVPNSMPMSASFAVPTGNGSFFTSGETEYLCMDKSGLPPTLHVELFTESGKHYELKNDWSMVLRLV